MSTHISFTDIGQFRNAIRAVKDRATFAGKSENGEPLYNPLAPLPTLDYVGTVKLHGTNFAVGCMVDGPLWYQSRENIITLDSDNAGAVRHFSQHEETLTQMLHNFIIPSEGLTGVIVYGEWCGQGIQKGVGVTQLPKRLVVFAIRRLHADGSFTWAAPHTVHRFRDPSIGVFNIYDYNTYSVSIDFAKPELTQNYLTQLTEAVETQCPVAAAHGVTGIGEGIVWKPVDPAWQDGRFWFKVKGEKHSVSKVKTLASVDVEKLDSQRAFIESVVTPARCEQSLSKLREAGKPLDRTSLGDFLRWIYNDVIKEESDTALANGHDLTKLSGAISTVAKTWFFTHEHEFDLDTRV